jgi:DNA polymerase-2
MTLWLLGEDGQRCRLQHAFAPSFYVGGPAGRLRAAWRWLQSLAEPPELARVERRNLFRPEPLAVLQVQTPRPSRLPALFNHVYSAFPDLDYYDVDMAPSLRYAAAWGIFPLAHVRVLLNSLGQVQALELLDSPWDLEPEAAPLRILEIEPECDPAHAPPRFLRLSCERAVHQVYSARLSLDHPRPLLINLRAILERYDPDLLLSGWGDTWLLPRLLALSEALGIPLPLNRDERLAPVLHAARSYFSYGQVVYRGEQVHLAGRWHIDRCNAMLWDDYSLQGAL